MIITRGYGYSDTIITRGYGTGQAIAEALNLISHITTSLNLESNIFNADFDLSSEIVTDLSLNSIVEI